VGSSGPQHPVSPGHGCAPAQSLMALPLVLAGPIVRRVEPRLCAVWIALPVSAKVKVRLWEGAQFATSTDGVVVSGDAPIASAERQTLRFGENLHIAVVMVTLTSPMAPLLPGHTYSYDVSFTAASGASNLRQAGLLRDEESDARLPGVDDAAPLHLALGYLEDRLPSFILPGATLEALNLVHTSCRRPATPLYDALAWLDDLLENTLDDTEARPQQLYLTGDQIYADDVATPLLPMLTQLGRELVGPDEMLPVGGQPVPGTLVNFPASRRAKLLRLEARFSTGDADNHLMTFGEFAAMYVAVWSSRVWRPLAAPAEIFVAAGPNQAVADLLTRWENCSKHPSLAEWKTRREPGVLRETEFTERFRDAVPRVARALANVPAYMICDDHEITDDWNLSRKWVNRVFTSPLGTAIVRNGLMAYGAFQGWGNDPALFEDATSNNGKFLKETIAVLAGPGTVPSAPTDMLDELLGLSTIDPKKQVQWHYQVPGALHHTIVLDTRTHRTFRGQGHAPPNLLGDTLKDQIPEGPLTGGRELLFVISAVPVVGPQAIERLGQPIAAIVQDFKVAFTRDDEYDDCTPSGVPIGSERRDVEGWVANEEALEALLARLSTYRSTVILSGDVHFGASATVDYWKKDVAAPARMLQLISSPAHNVFNSDVQALTRTNALIQRLAGEPAVERIAWKDPAPITLPQGETVPLTRLVRMKRSPALLISEGWPPGTEVAASKEPDWSWRITLMRDARPNDALPSALRQPFLPASAELNPMDALPAYRALAARHAAAALTHFDHLRTIVFNANIGLIHIEADAQGRALVHTLISQDAPDSVGPAANTAHRMPLEPSTDPRPVLQVRDA
jgi:hypothetical protein